MPDSPALTGLATPAAPKSAATTVDGGARRVRSFHPRRGRVTPGQRDALDRLWERYGVSIVEPADRDGDGGAAPIDVAGLFGGLLPVVVEIGFGMGETTARMALDEPARGVLAVDVHTPGQGNLLRLVERHDLDNVRVGDGDATVLLRESVPPGTLAGIRVYFPDPWPKARHHKRRLVSAGFARLAASRLAPGGTLHCATDWEPYAEAMLRVLSAEPGLRNAAPDGGFLPRPDWRPMTRFERRGLRLGHTVRDLLFERPA